MRVLVLLIATLHLSACASMGRPSPEACGVIGSVIGGTGGALGGASSSNKSSTGAGIAGGTAGFVLGALAAYYICKGMEEPPPPPPPPKPPPPPPPPPPPEPVVKEKIILRGVNFDFDKAEIRADAGVILDEAASILARNPDVTVTIEGHTDSTGPESYNQGLSERRAEAVKNHLAEQGIAADSLSTVGHGEMKPIASNETREGRALNRRVELEVMRE
jgi:OOP family OmpA-OmpF porin